MKGPAPWTVCLVIFGPFMAFEFRAWFGWLHKTIRHAAISIIPSEYRERYEEEWQSNLKEVPGEVGKLLYSFGLLQASLGIRIAARPFGDKIKRTADIAIAAGTLSIFGPLFVLISLAIKISSPGPVFVRAYFADHERNKKFAGLRFRTHAYFPSEGYRPTALGTLLRRFHLHTLPAYVSLLKGDLSLRRPPF